MTETKVSAAAYESKSWTTIQYNNEHGWRITILRDATLSADVNKWRILMNRSEIEPAIELLGHSPDFYYFNAMYIPAFCNMLKNNKVIKRLTFSKGLNNTGMKSVCKVLQTNNTITHMQFVGNAFNGSNGSDLEHLLLHNKCIKSLEVDNVRNEGADGIAKALPHNSTITKLTIWNTSDNPSIDKKGMRLLSKGLMYNHSVTSIQLYHQNICDEGAKDLCSVLEVNHTITHINLGNNGIVYLPETFAFLTHINKLDLDFNDNILFPPLHVVYDGNQNALFKFFADFRRFRMRFHFLLGFRKRLGINSSIQSYLYGINKFSSSGSSIFEAALLSVIFEML